MITLTISDSDSDAKIKQGSVSGEVTMFDELVELFKLAALAVGYTEGTVQSIMSQTELDDEITSLTVQNQLLRESNTSLLKILKAKK
jgi:hypothetical protein